mmetsp:Transcript_23113/g.54997  ORF Transcript_23113/g.54997 Transcript_23113/m.54997 type:complete len:177 (+) Transcript_23113:2582-3112(+)
MLLPAGAAVAALHVPRRQGELSSEGALCDGSVAWHVPAFEGGRPGRVLEPSRGSRADGGAVFGACRRVSSCAGLLTSQVARIQGGRVAEFDKAICEYIDASYHDGVGGDSATGVRWWILFICRGLGEDARRVLGPDASLDAKLREELVVLRFVCWLVEVRGVTPETARKYVSTVQA